MLALLLSTSPPRSNTKEMRKMVDLGWWMILMRDLLNDIGTQPPVETEYKAILLIDSAIEEEYIAETEGIGRIQSLKKEQRVCSVRHGR
jgi:hypothetical protein